MGPHFPIDEIRTYLTNHHKGLEACLSEDQEACFVGEINYYHWGLLGKIWAALQILVLTKMCRIFQDSRCHRVIVVCFSAFRFLVRTFSFWAFSYQRGVVLKPGISCFSCCALNFIFKLLSLFQIKISIGRDARLPFNSILFPFWPVS